MVLDREEFLKRYHDVHIIEPEKTIRHQIAVHQRESDVPICMGELNELALELTRFQRGKMGRPDLLQELAHVQWAIWDLQVMFDIKDEEVRRAIQASFRWD